MKAKKYQMGGQEDLARSTPKPMTPAQSRKAFDEMMAR
jgi:hypothetical protein